MVNDADITQITSDVAGQRIKDNDLVRELRRQLLESIDTVNAQHRELEQLRHYNGRLLSELSVYKTLSPENER